MVKRKPPIDATRFSLHKGFNLKENASKFKYTCYTCSRKFTEKEDCVGFEAYGVVHNLICKQCAVELGLIW